MLSFTYTTRERISKAKVQLFRDSPFVSYIVDHLKLRETEAIPTMGVTLDGCLLYNPKFVESITPQQLVGVLAHEVFHVSLLHVFRCRERQPMLWNIAADIVVNNLILKNGFQLPADCILPENDSIEVFGLRVEEISTKSTEDIYKLIQAQAKQQQQEGEGGEGDGEGKEEGNGGGSGKYGPDDHSQWKKKFGEGNGEGSEQSQGKGSESPMSPEELQSRMDKVREVVERAYTYSKMQGKTPSGMEVYYENLRKEKVNWRSFLRKVVASSIPADFSWRKPNKKFVWNDMYMPSIYGEQLKVLVHIDTSGSIGVKELSDFMSEIIGISRSFSNVDFRVLAGDCEIADDIPVKNGNRKKLLSMKLHGGGGTDHRPLFEYIKQKGYHKKETKLLVVFTDGYTTFPTERQPVDTIVVLSEQSTRDAVPSWARYVEL